MTKSSTTKRASSTRTTPKTRKTTTKTASPKPAVAKVPVPETPAAVVAAPTVVTPAKPVVSSGELRKPDLIDAVVAKTGAKPRDVKPIIDAVLTVLGDAVSADQDLSLPPFGKIKLQRSKDTEKARITVAKLRQPKP